MLLHYIEHEVRRLNQPNGENLKFKTSNGWFFFLDEGDSRRCFECRAASHQCFMLLFRFMHVFLYVCFCVCVYGTPSIAARREKGIFQKRKKKIHHKTRSKCVLIKNFSNKSSTGFCDACRRHIIFSLSIVSLCAPLYACVSVQFCVQFKR